jgi:hypothetical protein
MEVAARAAPSLSRLPRDWRLALYGVLGALALLSLWPLAHVAGWSVLLGIPAAGILLALALVSRFCRALAQVVGAILVPWLCLIGFNQILHWILEPWRAETGKQVRPSLELGLILAAVVFAVASVGYLVAWREKKWATPIVAIALAAVNVIGVPLLLAAPRRESTVAAPQPVVSKLDVAIVVPEAGPARLRPAEPSAATPDWDVRYSVARSGGKTVDWLLLDSADAGAALLAARGAGPPLPGAPAWRAGADQLVLLDVDGVAPVTPNPSALPSVRAAKGEVRRWLRIARAIAPEVTVAVLLQTTDRARLDAWARKVEPAGGSVAAIQRLGTPNLTDAALLLAAQAPSASEDLTLALRFRPVLLFDDSETLDTPLEINGFLASKRVELCHDDRLKGSRCDPVTRSSDLVSGSTHLRIRRRKASDPEPASAIYVRPTAVKQDGRDLLFLDYWWYLDGNPAAVGAGTSCGVGLSLPGKTCFDHDSDWEGMTVVLDRSGGDAVPVAVQYAEHSDVVRYDYAQLRDDWRDKREHDRSWRAPRFRQNLARIGDLDQRPVAFVAQGTHAAYRHVCPGGCHQVATGLTENPHDGLDSWPANDTAQCIATACLRLLPTRHGGRDPALWNAYDGVWGDRRCILRGAYCTAEVSPGAPATQDRYKSPARITGYVDANWRFHACGGDRPACPPLPLPGA